MVSLIHAKPCSLLHRNLMHAVVINSVHCVLRLRCRLSNLICYWKGGPTTALSLVGTHTLTKSWYLTAEHPLCKSGFGQRYPVFLVRDYPDRILAPRIPPRAPPVKSLAKIQLLTLWLYLGASPHLHNTTRYIQTRGRHLIPCRFYSASRTILIVLYSTQYRTKFSVRIY
jgi:hypothetical protein